MNRIPAEKKYQCTSCGAVHWYAAQECQRCRKPGSVKETKKGDKRHAHS